MTAIGLSSETSVQVAEPRGGRFVTGGIAYRDLAHETLISICLVFSVVAVLTPILLLTSVKVGFIDSLRQQFIEDPSFREIRPVSAELRPAELFEEISTWDGIAYVMPTVMMNPREVGIRARGATGIYRDSPRLIPSTAADPLLRDLKGAAPKDDGIVVTEALLEAAGLEIGAQLTLGVTRIVNDTREAVRFDVEIVGSVPSDVVDVPTIFAAPALDSQVEAFRAGIAVPKRGWAGINAEPRPAVGEILVVVPDSLGATLETELRVRVGARETGVVEAAEIADVIGAGPLTLGPAARYFRLRPGPAFYSARDLDEANAVLSNSTAYAVGLSAPVEVMALNADLTLAAYPEGLGASPEAGEVPDVAARGKGFRLNDRIALPDRLRPSWQSAGEPARLPVRVDYGEGSSTKSVTLELTVAGFHGGRTALVSSDLLGLIHRGREIPVTFDAAERRIVELSAGFRGFRAVGEDIAAIPGLVDRFEAEGIPVRAKSAQILKLQRLEQSLNLLVAVVAVVALVGGMSILTSSFFANVQRKRVSYATLRLIGMSKRDIASIPILQGAMIATAGFLLSVLCYFLIAALLNGAVSQELEFEGRLSSLYASHFFWAGFVVIGGACLASLFAARAATRIDPAAALRAGA